MKPEKNIVSFIGCDSEYQDSKMVLFGAGFDGTTSYRPGTRFAPAEIRANSYGIETYSPYLDKDLEDFQVFDMGDLELPFGNTVKVLDIIQETAKNIIGDNKMPLMIGGEHLVSLPVVRELAKKYKNLHIVHFDAHTDLREEYLGETLSHASVIKRCHDILGDGKIFQFGIRSGERQEFQWATKHTQLNKFDFNGLEKIKDIIGNAPVYFTIDLDILDSSVFPGTGTPEAGGVSFVQLQDAIKQVAMLNVVGADIVELSPPYDSSGASTALACKILRELILSICPV